MSLNENEKKALKECEKDLGDSSPDFLNKITTKCGLHLFKYMANIIGAKTATVFYRLGCAFHFPKNWVQI